MCLFCITCADGDKVGDGPAVEDVLEVAAKHLTGYLEANKVKSLNVFNSLIVPTLMHTP